MASALVTGMRNYKSFFCPSQASSPHTLWQHPHNHSRMQRYVL